jgi:hypothetical protein
MSTVSSRAWPPSSVRRRLGAQSRQSSGASFEPSRQRAESGHRPRSWPVSKGASTSRVSTRSRLIDPGLRLDDWVLFSTGPFPAASAFFSRESDLQRFVEACLGSSVFRNLEPFKPDGRRSCREFRLPDGRRIDLLCQERTKSGKGALVAIELKREQQRGTVQQLVEYLDALKRMFPSRTVKGVIISGREDQVAATMLKSVVGYDIQWFCYDVSFKKLLPSS